MRTSDEEYLLRLAAGLESAYRSTGARTFVFTAAGAATEVSALTRSLERKLSELGFRASAVDAASVLHAPQGRRHAAALLADAKGTIAVEGFAVTHLEQLKKNSDLILLDAAPLLQSAEAEYAARSADATILVVESGVTTRDELCRSAALLERLHAPGVAVVLQGVRRQSAEGAVSKSEIRRRKPQSLASWARPILGTASRIRAPSGIRRFSRCSKR